MFDIGWPELAVVLIVALLVIGPRDLPKALHTVGKWVKAARRVTSDFQRHVDDMMREAELDDLRKVANQARSLNVKNQIEKAIDPTGSLKNAFDVNTPSSTPAAEPAPPGPGVPIETKTGAAPEPPTAPAKPAAAAKKAAAAGKSAKASPRTPSRIPKRAARTAAGPASESAPAKAPAPEKTP